MRKIKKCFLLLTLVLCLLFTSISTNIYAEVDLGSWTTRANMPTARFALGVVSANSKIYAIGGFEGNTSTISTNITEEYDPATDQWTTKASMPTRRAYLGVVSVNNKIYTLGGWTDSGKTNIVEEYDPVTDQWTTKANMPTARQSLSVIAVNNKIYAIGGKTNNGSTNIVEEYDPVTDQWTTKTSMPTARYLLGAVQVNNKIYAIGGHTGSAGTNIVEEYDPATDQWTTKASMPTIRFALRLAELNNEIYAVGGIVNSGSLVSSNIVEKYDPITDQWESVAYMSTPKHNLGLAQVNNKIYTIGGIYSTSSSTECLNTVEEYTPPQYQNLTLGIEADSYEVQFGSLFDVYAKIYEATNIYTEDLTITYDSNLFELVNAQVVDPDKLGIYHAEHSTLGQARYILASKGEANCINGTSQLLKLTFKVKAMSGTGDIAISSGLVADGQERELTPICLGKTFTIAGLIGDVNRDGRYSLADLAIAAKLYNTMPDSWESYQPDTNINGVVEDIDLLTIVEAILNGGI